MSRVAVCSRCGATCTDPRPYAMTFECGGPGGDECDRRAAMTSGAYLMPDDVADAPDETAPADPPAPTVDARVLLSLAAQLDAMRSQIDAALVTIDGMLSVDGGRPLPLASSDVTGAEDDVCRHPANARQKLNLIGSGDDRPRWRCRDCGHEHIPQEG